MPQELNSRLHAGNRQRSWRIRGIVLAVAVLGAGADLLTKEWAFRTLGAETGEILWLLPELVGVQTSVNTGALFGMGQGGVHLFAIISLVALTAILGWYLWGRPPLDAWSSATVALILAGIAGNLYDRLGWWGTPGVRDFILFKFRDFHWPNFNLADSFLVCAAGLIAIRAVWPLPSRDAAGEPTDATTAITEVAD